MNVSLNENEEENTEFFDSIFPVVQKRPPGHLKILMIYDCKLITVNQFQELGAVDLDHAFIKFVMHLQFCEIDECMKLIEKFDDKYDYLFAELLSVF